VSRGVGRVEGDDGFAIGALDLAGELSKGSQEVAHVAHVGVMRDETIAEPVFSVVGADLDAVDDGFVFELHNFAGGPCISGYFGGWLDRVLVLINDSIFAFPYLLLAIVIAFLLSTSVVGGVLTAAIAITVVYIPQYFRVVRNTALSVREEPYVEAGRALGAKPRTVIRRYVFANVVHSVPVVASLNAADAILTLAALSFLGIGMDPSVAAEWGYDISRGIEDAQAGFWWTGLFSGLAVILLVTGLTLVGEGINDTFNPLLRRPNHRRFAMPKDAREATTAAVEAERAVVRVRDLRVWYATNRGPVRAVDGVRFEIRERETLGLVGESGGGKSTLGRGLMGLLPVAAIRDGSVDFEGRDLVKATQQEMCRLRGPSIGLVFQETDDPA